MWLEDPCNPWATAMVSRITEVGFLTTNCFNHPLYPPANCAIPLCSGDRQAIVSAGEVAGCRVRMPGGNPDVLFFVLGEFGNTCRVSHKM